MKGGQLITHKHTILLEVLRKTKQRNERKWSVEDVGEIFKCIKEERWGMILR